MALNRGASDQDRNDAALARRKAPVAREIPAPPLQPASSSEAQPTGSVSASSDGAAAAPAPTPETSALQPPVPAPAPETTEEHSIDASIATMPAPLPPVRKTAPVAQAKPQLRAPKPAALSTAVPKPQTEPAATEPKPRPQQPTSEQLGPALAIASSIPAPDESPSPQSTPQSAAPALEVPTSAREAVPPPQPTSRPAAPAEVGGTEPTLPAPAIDVQPVRPIDRLHMATVQAEAHDDLTTLRQLKNSWKTFTQKMGVGPDRSRAKREYADCIWAIQALTGRIQDQKDALQAYREFLLNAPAGGSDTRSISRLRQLEDALNERR
jgi:DNA polymerase-3 subunit gamma/tau